MDRVARQVGVRDMALHALDQQASGQRTAASVLAYVAQRLGGGRFADDAVVELFAALAQLVADDHRSVDCRPLFVGGDQQGDRTRVFGVRRHELLGRHHEGGDRAFHVGGTLPYRNPSRSVGTKGSLSHLSRGPGGTTSVWPANTVRGAPAPRRAHRLVTPPRAIVSH